MRLLILTLTLTLILLASCSSRKVMKDCEHLEGDFWSCEKP
jgi:hypothetical protein